MHPSASNPAAVREWVLRAARREDLPHLQNLIGVSVRTLHARYYSPAQIESSLGSVYGVDTQLIDDGTYFVADVDSEVVGCGGWSRRQAMYGSSGARLVPDPEIDPARGAARIRAFFVHPDWIRRGIGRRILMQSERAIEARGFRRIELVATLAGEPLYTAFGYVVAERTEILLNADLKLPVVRMFKLLQSVNPTG